MDQGPFRDALVQLGTHASVLPWTTESGSGQAAVPVKDPYGDTGFVVLDLDGGETGSFGFHGAGMVLPTAGGFALPREDVGEIDLAAWRPDGGPPTEIVSEGPMSEALSAAVDPAGERVALVWVEQSVPFAPKVVQFSSFDVRDLTRHLDRGVFEADAGALVDSSLVGTNRFGDSLILARIDGAVTARWITALDDEGETFGLALPLLAQPAYTTADPRSTDALAPLLDGSLALRVGGAWVGTFAPGATSLGPLPEWLRGHDGMQLTQIARGRGYALFDPRIAAAECSHPVELVDATGQSCGSIGFDTRSSDCGSGWFSVGSAGSVFAVLPPENVPRGMVGTASTLRRWPLLFR